MTTERQRAAARRNVRKAQAAWQGMSSAEQVRAQPQGRRRKKPGTTGQGEFYRIVVRPKEEFVIFRTQDTGRPGHIERVAGKRSRGSWATQAWLVNKQDAHIDHGRLVPDSADARELLDQLGSAPVHVKGDIFEALDRPNVPEWAKPTAAQQRARSANIRKAQAARPS